MTVLSIHGRRGKVTVGSIRFNEDENRVFIGNIFIKIRYRGKGYGTKAVKILQHRGKPIVVLAQYDAVAFYEKLGFAFYPEYRKKRRERGIPMIWRPTRKGRVCL